VDGNGGAEHATVDTGATVSVTGTLVVGSGANAAGVLAVGGGGTVSVRAARTGPFQGVVLATGSATATGSLAVGGDTGEAVRNDVGDFVDGAFGQGTATLTTGGTVTIGGTLFIGSASPFVAGVGTMQVSGGLLTAADVQISPGSTLAAAPLARWWRNGGASATQGIDIAPGRRCSAPAWSAAMSPTMARSSPTFRWGR
jgi:hypothetical protein